MTDKIGGYLEKGGILTDGYGEPIGTYKFLSTWKTPRSYVSSTMSSVEATVNGIKYVGRSACIGMFFSGKRKAKQNPVKKGARRISQVTRKRPSQRLVKRRLKRKVKGYFANPKRKPLRALRIRKVKNPVPYAARPRRTLIIFKIEMQKGKSWRDTGYRFETRANAVKWAQWAADQVGKPFRVVG